MKRLLLLTLTALLLGACAPAVPETTTLRLGLLPILETLPLHVAQSQGYFAAEGVQVEFIPAASAAERDQLMQAGQIDGLINDLVSTVLYNRDGVQIVIVRFARTATSEDPAYRILASSDSGLTSVQDLAGVPIGLSQGTVIEYVTDRLLQAEGLAPEDIQTVAVPKIADRMALLESGELQAATLPDPLSSLALPRPSWTRARRPSPPSCAPSRRPRPRSTPIPPAGPRCSATTSLSRRRWWGRTSSPRSRQPPCRRRRSTPTRSPGQWRRGW